MVEIIGYKTVTVGEEIVEEPVYAEPIIVIGSGENQTIQSVAEYEQERADAIALAEAERLSAEAISS